MNRTVIVVALVCACAISCYGRRFELMAAVRECKNQHNIDPDQIKEAVKSRKLPDSEDGQCFMSCVMEKIGVIKNDKIDLERSMELNKKYFKISEHLDKANEIAKRCANVHARGSKPCSLGIELAKCVMKNAAELKLDLP